MAGERRSTYIIIEFRSSRTARALKTRQPGRMQFINLILIAPAVFLHMDRGHGCSAMMMGTIGGTAIIGVRNVQPCGCHLL
jgi:hypothetical protein